MNYFLTEEEQQIQGLFRDFAERELMPRRRELDEANTFPHDLVEKMAKLDMFRLLIPDEYGGFGNTTLNVSLAIEQLSRAEPGTAICWGACGLGSLPIILGASHEQKERYLPKVASGEHLAAFAITEHEAGSDASNIKTIAEKRGDSYILNGAKRFCTNAGEAQVYTVIATTNPNAGIRGLSAFILEKGYDGMTFGEPEDKLGIRASVQREIYFDNCVVPAENLMSGEGRGFKIAMATLDHSRPEVGAQALGIAQGAYEEAARYVQEREQFDSKLSSFQGVQFILADMAIQIEASRALLYSVARYIDSHPKERPSKMSAIVKTHCSDTAMKVTLDAMQLFGGYGFMKEYIIEKYVRDAKITQIYEGSNQIQRVVIGREINREFKG